jgi:hypothetical protein
VQVVVVKEGLMWMPSYGEGEEVAWVVMSWVVEGLLKWGFSTHVAIIGLEEEDHPLLCWHTPWLRSILHGRIIPI